MPHDAILIASPGKEDLRTWKDLNPRYPLETS